MIVVDASAFVELLTDESGLGAQVRDALMSDADWVVPEHTMTETANALRGLWLGGRCTDTEFDARLEKLAALEPLRVPVVALLPRIRALCSNANVYDGAYLALAEHLDAPLLTLDRKLAAVPGARADVRVVAPG